MSATHHSTSVAGAGMRGMHGAAARHRRATPTTRASGAEARPQRCARRVGRCAHRTASRRGAQLSAGPHALSSKTLRTTLLSSTACELATSRSRYHLPASCISALERLLTLLSLSLGHLAPDRRRSHVPPSRRAPLPLPLASLSSTTRRTAQPRQALACGHFVSRPHSTPSRLAAAAADPPLCHDPPLFSSHSELPRPEPGAAAPREPHHMPRASAGAAHAGAAADSSLRSAQSRRCVSIPVLPRARLRQLTLSPCSPAAIVLR